MDKVNKKGLKPCPFCGSENVSFDLTGEWVNYYWRGVFVKCWKCGAKSKNFFFNRDPRNEKEDESYAEKRAAEQWNARA